MKKGQKKKDLSQLGLTRQTLDSGHKIEITS